MNFTNIHRNLDPLTFETIYSERNSKKYQTSKTTQFFIISKYQYYDILVLLKGYYDE